MGAKLGVWSLFVLLAQIVLGCARVPASGEELGEITQAVCGVCPPCQKCSGASCVADPTQNGLACPDDGNACTTDLCNATGTCVHAAGNAGTVCRAAAGTCDVAESCTGGSTTCPADSFLNNSTVCRAAVGACDVAEKCPGNGANCPADAVASNATVCRAAVAGGCDIAENCDGAGKTCPADVIQPAGTTCRGAAGVCDVAESCDGAANTCPADAKIAAGTACADDGNPCTLDQCNGAATACQHPAGNAGAICRGVAGVCDLAETCTGSSTSCPADVFVNNSTVCRAASGVCDVAEKCPGNGANCPGDTVASSATVCRGAVAGGCDIAENCDGAGKTCPADIVQPAGTTCRASGGVCDIAEACDGAANTCPVDTKVASGTACADDGNPCTLDQCNGAAVACQHPAGNAGTVCRGAAGVCDIAETCTGGSTSCPADAFMNNSTVCRAASGVCDLAEKCPGNAANCPADAVASLATVCRAAVAGGCDTAENCDGAGKTCPTDVVQPAGTTCRASAGVCDVAETCDGAANTCPLDAKVASGTACPDDGNLCTLDQCNGAAAACQHPAGNAGTICRAAVGICDVIEVCSGASTSCPADAFVSSATVCRPAVGVCDTAEKCPGNGPACPADAVASTATVCRAAVAGGCDLAENCDGASKSCPGDVVQPAGTTCRASAGVCDIAETCDGAANTCPADAKSASGVACPDDGNPCTLDQCNGALTTCQHPAGNAGSVCRAAAGVCDVIEICSGSSTVCPTDKKAPNSAVCRATIGTCDIQEKCDGTTNNCPADVVQPSGYVCRAAVAGGCDFAETCDGAAGVCPADVIAASGAACTDDTDDCTVDVCSGSSASCPRAPVPNCSHGLTASYYDNIDFTGPAVPRIDPTVNFNWGLGSPDPTIANTTYTARWTGLVEPLYNETYTFETQTDDGARLWVNGVLLVNQWKDQGATKVTGTITLVAGQKYDIKMDYYQNSSGASAVLRWSSPSTPYQVIPTIRLFPDGDLGTSGFSTAGAGNDGTGDPYVIWRLSDVPGAAPVDASAESPNTWGLGNTVMMVPSFSPDGTKLVFIDGDEGGGAGWRKGLSVFDFNEAGKSFSNRRSIRNTWPWGDVMKWPVFESDSRSIIFQTSMPTEICTQCDAHTGQRYGNMAPTNYYGTQGILWSVDAATSSTPVPLTQLNTGEQPADANKSYQPTVLPASAGGYRWVVFTSTRPYGNTLNPASTDRSCLASQLWVSAIDDVTTSTTDRSHPAFWLPNQNIGGPDTTSYVNERAYWVLQPCKATGTGADSLCTTNEDCCGATSSPQTAACRVDQPVASPPTRHCVGLTPNTCSMDTMSCSVDTDCCAYPSSHCIAGSCQAPVKVGAFNEGTFVRDYEGVCPKGTTAIWRFFDWKSETPDDSRIVFTAQTADTVAALDSAPSVDIGMVSGPPHTGWVGADVGAALPMQASQHYLRITVDMKPSTDRNSAPVLTDWRQSFSCAPSE